LSVEEIVFEPELNIEHLWQMATCQTKTNDYIEKDFDPSRSEYDSRSNL